MPAAAIVCNPWVACSFPLYRLRVPLEPVSDNSNANGLERKPVHSNLHCQEYLGPVPSGRLWKDITAEKDISS